MKKNSLKKSLKSFRAYKLAKKLTQSSFKRRLELTAKQQYRMLMGALALITVMMAINEYLTHETTKLAAEFNAQPAYEKSMNVNYAEKRAKEQRSLAGMHNPAR
jgi:hypothetical protein